MRADPIARLGQRARQLARRHEIAVHVLERSASLDEVMAEASASCLVVMGPLSHLSWKRFHLGTTLDQAVHGSVCPLLVVKQAPDKPYARVLVAVGLSPGSMPLIDFAGRFSTPTMLTLFHAIDTLDEAKLRSVDVSHEAIQANQFGSHLRARDRLAQLIGALDVNRHPLAFDVGLAIPPIRPHCTCRPHKASWSWWANGAARRWRISSPAAWRSASPSGPTVMC